jgi:hypothetical protein
VLADDRILGRKLGCTCNNDGRTAGQGNRNHHNRMRMPKTCLIPLKRDSEIPRDKEEVEVHIGCCGFNSISIVTPPLALPDRNHMRRTASKALLWWYTAIACSNELMSCGQVRYPVRKQGIASLLCVKGSDLRCTRMEHCRRLLKLVWKSPWDLLPCVAQVLTSKINALPSGQGSRAYLTATTPR